MKSTENYKVVYIYVKDFQLFEIECKTIKQAQKHYDRLITNSDVLCCEIIGG